MECGKLNAVVTHLGKEEDYCCSLRRFIMYWITVWLSYNTFFLQTQKFLHTSLLKFNAVLCFVRLEYTFVTHILKLSFLSYNFCFSLLFVWGLSSVLCMLMNLQAKSVATNNLCLDDLLCVMCTGLYQTEKISC